MNPRRIGFLLVEAVAAVNLKEMGRDAKSFDDFPADTKRLVRQYGHSGSGGSQLIQRFPYAGIQDSVVELVVAVVRKKKFECALDVGFGRLWTQSAAHEHRCTVSDI